MVYKNRTRQVLLYVIGTLLLSSCDYRIWGSINNKTDSDARIMCYLVEKSRWDSLSSPSRSNSESLTSGAYFAVNEINKGEDSLFVMIDDSTYCVTLSPDESMGMGMVMNHFWTRERIQSYLQFLKRMEIQMPHDTIVYNETKELTDFFWKHKKSKQEIRINIRDNYIMKLVDKLF